MRKKIFFKATALLACVALLSLYVPNLIAAEKGTPESNFRLLLEKPVNFISSLLSFLPVFDSGNSPSSDQVKKEKENNKTKITGGMGIGKVSDGD